MSIVGFPWRGGIGQSRKAAPLAPCEVFSACGAAALYRRDAFEALGGFEERFFCYCEDVDLGFRLRRAGLTCLLEPRAIVRHLGEGSSGGKGSEFAEYHGTRNRLWTFARNMPRSLAPVAWLGHLLLMTFVLLHTPSRLKVRFRALRDALRNPSMLSRAPVEREVSPLVVAQALSWSPLAAAGRRIVTRSIRREK